MKNKSKGMTLIVIGILILCSITAILYYLNSTAQSVFNTLGIIGETTLAIQIIVLLIAGCLLFLGILSGVFSIIFGVGYMRNDTPFNQLKEFFNTLFDLIFKNND